MEDATIIAPRQHAEQAYVALNSQPVKDGATTMRLIACEAAGYGVEEDFEGAARKLFERAQSNCQQAHTTIRLCARLAHRYAVVRSSPNDTLLDLESWIVLVNALRHAPFRVRQGPDFSSHRAQFSAAENPAAQYFVDLNVLSDVSTCETEHAA